VGAFAAGLVLDDVQYKGLRERDAKKRDLRELLEPISSFLVPVFFVLMGMGVDLGRSHGRACSGSRRCSRSPR
jgi:Kef-type K+ transport system membrane component KefB